MNDVKSLTRDFKNLSKLWPYIKEWKPQLIGAVILVPLILIVHSLVPLVVKYAVDDGMTGGDFEVITKAAMFYLALTSLEYILRGGQTVLLATTTHRLVKKLRQTLVRHVMKLSCRYHDTHMSGALVTRATSDFDNISESLNQGVLNAVVDLAVIIGAILGLLYLHWQLALIVVILLPGVAALIVFFSKGLKSTMLVARKKIASLNAFIQECLYGIQTIKTLGAEASSGAAVEFKAIDYRDAQMKTVALDASMFAVLDGISSFVIGLFLWLAVSPTIESFGMEPVSAGVIVAFISYIGSLFEPLKQLGNKMAMMQGMFTGIDRIFGILDAKSFIEGDRDISSIDGNVLFEKVSFAYDSKDVKPNEPTQGPEDPSKASRQQILHEVSFEVQKGKSLAIVGRTGSGKSTIIKLIAKLYDGYTGRILMNGIDLNEISEDSVRKRIAVVTQDLTLFEGSIAFNITLGNEAITSEQVEAAAKIVGANKFIDALDGGYDYQVAASGTNLSVGQRQLISFARALAKQPDLIILDEATSSVDPTQEAAIQEAIRSILAESTVIVIAHRLSTIMDCDRILVLKDGRVEQAGTHQELMGDEQGIYADLVRHFQGRG